MARLTWVLAVSGLTTSEAAISSLDRPAATRATTSRSRSVSAATPGQARQAGARRPRRRNRPHPGPPR